VVATAWACGPRDSPFARRKSPQTKFSKPYIGGSQDATTGLRFRSGAPRCHAPLCRFGSRSGTWPSGQVASASRSLLMRWGSRCAAPSGSTGGELQPEGQQQGRGRHWRNRADPLADVWESVLVPMLEKAPQLEPQTLLLHLEQAFPGQEWYRRKRNLQRCVEQWRALHGPAREVMFLQHH
jgi:hypothetical protein